MVARCFVAMIVAMAVAMFVAMFVRWAAPIAGGCQPFRPRQFKHWKGANYEDCIHGCCDGLRHRWWMSAFQASWTSPEGAASTSIGQSPIQFYRCNIPMQYTNANTDAIYRCINRCINPIQHPHLAISFPALDIQSLIAPYRFYTLPDYNNIFSFRAGTFPSFPGLGKPARHLWQLEKVCNACLWFVHF